VRTGADQPWAEIGIIPRVAVQFRLAAPRPTGDLLVVGLRSWSRSAPTPATIPPGRSAWVQSNFLMNNCSLLPPHAALTANDHGHLPHERSRGQPADRGTGRPHHPQALTRSKKSRL